MPGVRNQMTDAGSPMSDAGRSQKLVVRRRMNNVEWGKDARSQKSDDRCWKSDVRCWTKSEVGSQKKNE
jgi:hypothetical protein